VELSPGDQQQLATAQGISDLLQQQQPQLRLTPEQAGQLARELGPLLPQLLPGIAATGNLFFQQLSRRTLDRVAAAVDSSSSRGQQQDGSDYIAPMDL
jgi:hypothetical protein